MFCHSLFPNKPSPTVDPMPCAHKVPSQHFTEYFKVSLQRHPRLPPLGDDLDKSIYFLLSISIKLLRPTKVTHFYILFPPAQRALPPFA
jgi:hypothetical protein